MQSDVVGSTERLALMSALNRARTLEERLVGMSERLGDADDKRRSLELQLDDVRRTAQTRTGEGPSDRVVRGQTDEGQPSTAATQFTTGPGREAQVCPHCGAAY